MKPKSKGIEAVDRWLSVTEIAKYLGVSKETMYRIIESKTLPAHKIGKLWKFKVSEIDQAIMKSKNIRLPKKKR